MLKDRPVSEYIDFFGGGTRVLIVGERRGKDAIKKGEDQNNKYI